jgi:cytochrome P450
MHLPDGPKTPAFLQTLQWIVRPLETLDYRLKKYGDTFRIFGNQFPPTLYFSSPQAIQAIMTAAPDQIGYVDSNKLLKPLVGENSLLVLSGERHQRQRKLLMPPFHGERMRAYGQIINNITSQVMSKWTFGKPFAVREAMQDITLRVILMAVFGIQEGAHFEQLHQLFSSILNSINSPLSSIFLFYPFLQRDLGDWSPWGRFLRQQQQINKILFAEIQKRRSQGDLSRTDILSLLISARDENDQAMTDAELRDELLTLLFGGYENTSAALAWALYSINHLPEVKDKLLKELNTLGLEAEVSAIARLPYLTAVCQETLRLYPVTLSGFPRLIKKPMKLMNYELEPGTVLIASIYLAHQREDVYPNPKQFRPERFLERQFSPYEYLPFGGGSRRCIGMAFASFEMKLVLATIMSKLQLALVDQRQIRPVRQGLVIAPSNHLRLVVTGVR